MIESGVIHNYIHKYRVKKTEVYNKQYLYSDKIYLFFFKGCLGNGLDALALDNLQGIFLILIGAFALAILLLFIECFIK